MTGRIVIMIIVIITVISPRPRNNGLVTSRDSLSSWGEGAFLTLVSGDGVLINILVCRHSYTHR